MKAFELMEEMSIDPVIRKPVEVGSMSFFEHQYQESKHLNEVLESYLGGIMAVKKLDKFIGLNKFDAVSSACLEAIFDSVGLVSDSGDLKREAENGSTMIREAISGGHTETIGKILQLAVSNSEQLNVCTSRVREATRNNYMGDIIKNYSGERFFTPLGKVDSDDMSEFKLSRIMISALDKCEEISGTVESLKVLYNKAGMEGPSDAKVRSAMVYNDKINDAMESIHEAVLLLNRYKL